MPGSDLTPARLEERPQIRLEKLIQMHEKDARTHERHGRLGDAAFHSETADRLAPLAARMIELEGERDALRLAGKHLALKLAEVYRMGKVSPSEC